MPIVYDFIVVGSGPSGAIAAHTLLEGGAKTLMLDVGETDNHYKHLIPNEDFITIRKTDRAQHRYFLGDDFEGIPLGEKDNDQHLTPPRNYITRLVDELTPLVSDSFKPMESLAYGGLGNGWGAGCFAYSPSRRSGE